MKRHPVRVGFQALPGHASHWVVLGAVVIFAVAGASAQPLDLLQTFDAQSEVILNGMKSVEAMEKPGLLRKRPALLNPDAVLAQGVTAGSTVRFALFDEERVDGTIEKITRRGAVDYSWVGSLTGPDGGRFYVTILDGVMAALLMPNDGRLFQVTYAGNGVQEIGEYDAVQMLGCALDEALSGGSPGKGAGKGAGDPMPKLGSIGLQSDPSTQFDIMIVYTPLARSNAGGTAAIEAEVANAVSLANDAYTNSGVATQMRLVYTGEVSYTEVDDLGTNLTRLAAPADGHMDSVHTLRDQYGADFVALLVEPADPNGCGIGSLIGTLDPGNEDSAFSVTDRGCILNQTLTHEVGHNMGCTHNIEDAGGAGLYSYSYGWRFIGANDSQKYHTVMSYATGSYSVSTRIPYFSNPNVSYQGTPTGVDIGEAGESHNAQTINSAASTFANYRPIAGTMALTPFDSITFDGPWGGPFDPADDTLNVLSVDSSSLNWTASVDDSDVSDGGGGFLAPIDVSPTGGTLGAGADVDLTVTPNSDANLLPVGAHEVTLHVNDTTNAEEETLTVILEVRGVDSLEMDAISSPKGIDLPFPVMLSAKDSEGLAVPGFTGTVDLIGQTEGTPADETIGTIGSFYAALETDFETGRVQSILTESELSLDAGVISAVALYIHATPDPTLLRNWTLRLKHTSRSSFASTDEGWEDGWTTVYQNDETIDATGWRTFTLDTAFEYDGVSNLMLDYSFQNNATEKNTAGALRVTGTAGSQILLGAEDVSGGYGAPTGWSGFSPGFGTGGFRPTVRLTFAPYDEIAVSPSTTGNFSGGGWTGDVTIGSAYSSIRLSADDGSGHVAFSDFFAVTAIVTSTVWVDFNHNGSEIGSEIYPFDTLGEGVTVVDEGGTIKIKAGASAGPITIDKEVRIEADGGTARIGATP